MVPKQVVIILVLLNSIFKCSAQLVTNDDGQKCAGQVCLPSNYSRLIGPNKESSSIDIKIDLEVLQILEVNDRLFTVSFSMYFGVVWQDPRILSPPTADPNVPIALSFMDHLWVPDVYFYNLKSIQTLNIISEFAGIVVLFSHCIVCFKCSLILWHTCYSQVYGLSTRLKYGTLKKLMLNFGVLCGLKSTL
jgi:hypothetical protein